MFYLAFIKDEVCQVLYECAMQFFHKGRDGWVGNFEVNKGSYCGCVNSSFDPYN